MTALLRRTAGLVVVLLVVLFWRSPTSWADSEFRGWSEVPGHGTTATADAAVTYQSRIYLFGIGINDHAHYMNVFDGAQWSGWKPVPGGGTTNLPDTATAYNGKLYLFGIGINDHVHYMNVFDGTQWAGWKAVPGNGKSTNADMATTFASKIFLFAVGLDDHRHYVNMGSDQPSAESFSPHFDEVFQKGTHNAYWVNNNKTPDDPGAAGTQMRLWDQLVHEHVRSFELDLHRDIDDPQTNRKIQPALALLTAFSYFSVSTTLFRTTK